MMIELTVKTLDSQNHSFRVDDDITVAEFKQKIADTINIPPDTQRIIYCGRILKDEIKLSEYDVNGKVVHLVERAPPTTTQGPNRTSSPQPQRRNFRGFDHGMYLGSMAFPSNLMETQGIVPPPPTHSLAASRLNVAKRMLRRADGVLNLLENPTARGSDQASSEEPQEEVTPVFEARVIVPSNSLSEPIDEVISAVENSLFNTAPVAINGGQAVVIPDNHVEAGSFNGESADGRVENNIEMDSPPLHSASSTPEGASPVSTSVENLAADQQSGNNGDVAGANERSSEGATASTLAENASRTTEMADLLETLGRLQIRLAPFLEQYQNFMRQDPNVPTEDLRKTQAMINRVSEILHFLGHAYHSLSDIIVRVRTPPPRPLLCRPILIQHSAVVQTGFPIQVEAEINISPDNIQQNTTATTQANTATTTVSTTTSSNNANIPTGSTFTAHIPPHMLGLPLLPGSLHVQSFPIEIRGVRAASMGSNTGSSPANANFTNITANITASNSASDSGTNENTTSNTTTSTNTVVTTTAGTSSGSQFNNPNVEFFMEVTPETITIDSLETTLLGSNQAGDVLRGAMNGPPPEFLQSIMQMAGQIINRSTNQQAAATTTTASTSTSTTAASDSSNSSSQSTINPNALNVGQNSQARGNTQTHPTTSTHTRSTARPHVHLAQRAMQGFDPFLPCNSHHVTPRRRIQARTVQPQNNQNNNTRQETNAQGVPVGLNPNQLHPIYNIVQGIVNSFRNAYRQRNAPPTSQNAPPVTSSSASNNTSTDPSPPSEPAPSRPRHHAIPMPFWTFFPHLHNMNIAEVLASHSPTLSEVLAQLSDDNYVEGESIFTDLIMLFARNLTIADLIRIYNGWLLPLEGMSYRLRTFFLERVLDGTTSSAAIERGVNRFISEMQPLLDNLENLTVRDDIDIIRSTQMLLRARLPGIISLAASENRDSFEMLVDQCSVTLRQLCALILHASANGQQDVEELLDHIVRQSMQGVPRAFEAWTSCRAQLRQYFVNSNVPESALQQYIVRHAESITPPIELIPDGINKPPEEPMELDEQGASGSSSDLSNSVINLQNDSEPLPLVEIGSESWHNQVPAEWVPIIVRDSHRQRRQNSQPAFSDAYLSGMPSKRRKIVTNTKPQGSLPQVIQDSVRRAITATGLTTVAPLDTVSQAAAANINIQSAYRDLLRSSVQSTLQDNEDFTPERYPNASNYFNKPQ